MSKLPGVVLGIVLLTTGLAVEHRAAAFEIRPTGDWNGLRWGMTLEQVLNVMPEAQELDQPSIPHDPWLGDDTTKAWILAFHLGGAECLVMLDFYPGDSLHRVVIEPAWLETNDVWVASIRDALRKKYGNPRRTTSNDTEWVTDTTIVTLSDRKDGREPVLLTYESILHDEPKGNSRRDR
jgi:hypothetical protein